ncbi:MAG: hypothetical protein JXA57_13725 [Armatimonadetes bacterium]|nr:hypothetical protein [Armatimonadota bacterium]
MIHESLHCPLTRLRDAADRASLTALFPDISGSASPYFLALRPHLEQCPTRFFDRAAHQLMLDWLKRRYSAQPNELAQYLATATAHLGRAMRFLRQINAENWHDLQLPLGDDTEMLRFIDTHVHPGYLRLVEGILAPLVHPMAYFERIDRNKGLDGLDVYNLVQDLSTTTMAPCVTAYHHIVRNGIAHSGIAYAPGEIRYHDRKGGEATLSPQEVVRLCDDMLDICNGLASALKVFLLVRRDTQCRLPLELLVEELIEETRTPWWRIEGCLESRTIDGTQLIVYARPNTRDYPKVQVASVQSAVLAEFLAPGYGRYFISLRTPKALAGWAAFSGRELRRIRESSVFDLARIASAMEPPGVFYVPRPGIPRLLGRIETLLLSIRLHWPLAARQIPGNLSIPRIVCRYAQMHRNGWGYVLNGAVFIEGLTAMAAAETIRANKRRIVRNAAKQARAAQSWLSLVRYLCLGYARISVFSRDHRTRRLSDSGLAPELVCTVQIQRIRRIRSPDIFGSTVESRGNWRVAWNRAWLETGGRIANNEHAGDTQNTTVAG